MARREERKEINLEQVISYLTNAFNKASRHLGYKNHNGTALYDFQVEMMYLIDDIRRGPKYFAPKRITAANELIDRVSNYSEE